MRDGYRDPDERKWCVQPYLISSKLHRPLRRASRKLSIPQTYLAEMRRQRERHGSRVLTLGIDHALDHGADEDGVAQDDKLKAIVGDESDVLANLGHGSWSPAVLGTRRKKCGWW